MRFGAILSAATLLALGAGLVVIRGRRFAALADEGRPASRGTTAVIVLVAFVIALASATAGVGRGPGESTDPLLAAAVESWSREAFGAMSAGQPAEAARLLAIAADRAPHASTFYRLGLAERAAGRIDQARGAFRRAIAIDDKFEPARSALAGLESGQDSTSSIE